jgi:hypothetical protein
MIAQELTLSYRDKVDDLIIYASHCGSTQSSYYLDMLEQFSNTSGTEEEIKKRFVSYQFPES